ncbi:MAG TPA: MHYT domain-containing protein [Burkholderiales bacterium]|nr:MHYT domain-containing protein [Burkholderiales bacterium]
MQGSYHPGLVALSVAVAIIASYTALDLAGRVGATESGRRKRLAWLVAGAFSMGIGVWSMHFIGMLALRLPTPVAYDIPFTVASLLVAIAASAVALAILRGSTLGAGSLTAGATLMGAGIAAMHYTGMMALRMSPPVRYDPPLFMASVLIAIVASLAALWLAFQLRRRHFRLALLARVGSAAVMGAAIAGMHYTGMAAARFAPGSICLAATDGGIDAGRLAIVIGVFTTIVLLATLVISALDAHYAGSTARLARSLQAANEQLRNMALFDNLTGLPNRLLLEDRLQQALASYERFGRSFAILFVDLDRFKPVNDAFGHAVGDALLEAVAGRLTGQLRQSDTVARVGGDEFVMLLLEVAGPEDAVAVGQKIVEALTRPFKVREHELFISCSIGVSVCPRDGKETAVLLSKADMAMYRAKQSGSGMLRLFEPEPAAPQAVAPGP